MTQENQTRQGLKVVVEEMGGKAVVGVQAKDCDPIITVLPGLTLEGALEFVPALVATARERWAQAPKMPPYQRPPEPPKPQPAPVQAKPTAKAQKPPTPERARLL